MSTSWSPPARSNPIRVAHDILTCEPTPYIRVRGTAEAPVEARICRAVYYELVALAEPGMRHCRRMLGVWSSGLFFPLGRDATLRRLNARGVDMERPPNVTRPRSAPARGDVAAAGRSR